MKFERSQQPTHVPNDAALQASRVQGKAVQPSSGMDGQGGLGSDEEGTVSFFLLIAKYVPSEQRHAENLCM